MGSQSKGAEETNLTLNKGSTWLNQIIDDDYMTTGWVSLLQPNYPLITFSNLRADNLPFTAVSIPDK